MKSMSTVKHMQIPVICHIFTEMGVNCVSNLKIENLGQQSPCRLLFFAGIRR